MRQLEFRPNPSLYNLKVKGSQNSEEDISHPSLLSNGKRYGRQHIIRVHASSALQQRLEKVQTPAQSWECEAIGWQKSKLVGSRILFSNSGSISHLNSHPQKRHTDASHLKSQVCIPGQVPKWQNSGAGTITNLVLTSAKPHKDNIIQNCIYR